MVHNEQGAEETVAQEIQCDVTPIDHGPSTSGSVASTDIDHGPSTSGSVVPIDIDHGPSTSGSVAPTDTDHGPSMVVPTDVASSLNDSPGSPSTATVNDSSLVLYTKLSSLSAKLGLPVAAIDGIAKKAAEQRRNNCERPWILQGDKNGCQLLG